MVEVASLPWFVRAPAAWRVTGALVAGLALAAGSVGVAQAVTGPVQPTIGFLGVCPTGTPAHPQTAADAHVRLARGSRTLAVADVPWSGWVVLPVEAARRDVTITVDGVPFGSAGLYSGGGSIALAGPGCPPNTELGYSPPR